MPEDKNTDNKELKEEAEAAEETQKTAEEAEKETPESAETAEAESADAEDTADEETVSEAGEADAEPETEESASDGPGGEEASGDQAQDKPKRFWQKAGKTPKKDKRDEQIAELQDKVARQLAEFDNFRKRTEKEKAQNYTIGARDVLEKLLPVLDNFERGLKDVDLEDPFAAGMDKVYKQMVTTLEGLGVTPIEAEGKEFDPNFHNAVMHVEDENIGENIVTQELQKGYMYKDQVLRYAMVTVAN